MKKKIFLLAFGISIGPFYCLAGFKNIDAFAVLDPTVYKPDASSTYVVENMPPVESQDSLGICFGFSSAAVVQQYYCNKKNLDCQNLDPKKKISPLQMAAFSTDGEPGDITDLLNYDWVPKGGSGFMALLTAIDITKMGFTDSCFPWDQFVSKHGEDLTVHAAIFAKLKKKYEEHKKTEGTFCLDCLSKTLQQDFDMKIDNVRLIEALQAKTYDHFLYAIFLKDRYNDPVETYCKDLISFGSKPNVESFPSEKGAVADYESVMDVIIKQVKGNHPIVLDGICMERINGQCVCIKDGNGNCAKEARHSVAISGYRKACRQTSECLNKCEQKQCYVEALKVHNSWGKSWQRENDDGWVDAETLIKETEPLTTAILSWINPGT